MKHIKIIVGIVVLGVVLVAALGIYRFNFTNDDIYVADENGEIRPIDEVEVDDSAFARLLNAKIVAPASEKEVQLRGGRGSYQIAQDSASRGSVVVLDGFQTEWSNEGGRADLSVILVSNEGGSGTFYYLTLFDVGTEVVIKKSEIFLGDRVEIVNLGLGELVHDEEADYRLTLQTLVRAEDEPLNASPTLPRTQTFYVTEQLLEEVEQIENDT